MVEWLGLWTSDLLETLRGGLIPDTSDFLYIYIFFDDDGGGTTSSGAGKREAQASTYQNDVSYNFQNNVLKILKFFN